jgi:hypothetical protein
MRLRVRIEDGGAAGLPGVQALWERCATSINPPPIPDLQVPYGVTYEATNGYARLIPNHFRRSRIWWSAKLSWSSRPNGRS